LIYLSTPERFPRGPWRERAHRIALKGLGGGIFYGLVIEPRWLETTWIDFPVPGLPKSLDGYRIAHLTDIHHNALTGRRYLFRAIDRANALHPDMVALTGDYITHNPERMAKVVAWLGRLHAPDGVFATLGNHDYQFPLSRIRRLFEKHGIRLLEDEHAILYPRRLVGREGAPVTPLAVPSFRKPESAARKPKNKRMLDSPIDRFPQAPPWRHRWRRWLHTTGFHRRLIQEYYDPPAAYFRLDPEVHPVHHHPADETNGEVPCLCVAGVGDLWEGRCDIEEALNGAPRDVFRLLLSHNPEVANLISRKHRIGLVLSGHTHGGQTWPFHRSPIRKASSRRYLRGLIRSHATNVYVSRGVGSSALHFRWNCRPEITLIRLVRASNGSRST